MSNTQGKQRQEIIGMTIDEKTRRLIDAYSREHSLSRSAAIRYILNEFFIRENEKKDERKNLNMELRGGCSCGYGEKGN